jgi:S1-C subfamily serine protease
MKRGVIVKTKQQFSTLLAALVLILSACAPIVVQREASLPAATPAAQTGTTAPVVNVPSTTNPASGDPETVFIDIYQRVAPAVVYIETENGSGSGFVVDHNGHIVTNNHVIDGAQNIEVVFADGTRGAGTVIGRDVDADVAVLTVDVPSDKLTAVELGDSSTVAVGEYAIAIGNPFGLKNTMTVGIVSGLGRTLPSDRTAPGSNQGAYSNPNVIQTDAAINPGNSGGPLLDSHGRVIGINAAIRTDSSVNGQPVNSGVGFAIPINTVKRILPSLIEKGSYAYPYLGLSGLESLTLAQAKQLGLSQATGVYVTTIVPGGPADQAGVHAARTQGNGAGAGGDLIVGIDDLPVPDFSTLIGYLVTEKSPGDQVVLHVLRGTEQVDLTVTLGERP